MSDLGECKVNPVSYSRLGQLVGLVSRSALKEIHRAIACAMACDREAGQNKWAVP